MVMTNIVKDVSTLTTIPEKSLDKLFRKMIYCMCEAVQEDLLVDDGAELSELDIGIGILYVKHVADEIKYHFVPNDLLDKAMKQTVVNKQNLLENVLNDALAKKFIEVYKDLC